MKNDASIISKESLKERLTAEQYQVTQEKGTEPPFSGKYYNNSETGMYTCIVCGQELFSSSTKFDSGSGWPSFDDPANREHIELLEDTSMFMKRTEVTCKKCGAHLGHLFEDGPKENLPAGQTGLPAGRQATGLRYCINSCALNFQPKK